MSKYALAPGRPGSYGVDRNVMLDTLKARARRP